LEKYDLAVGLYKTSMERYSKTDGEKNSDFNKVMMELAGVYSELSRFKEAEGLYLKALETEKTLSGDRSEDYADILESMAELSMDEGEYEKSESISDWLRCTR
jgi:tetratricopeptide (TPR) repeat protein